MVESMGDAELDATSTAAQSTKRTQRFDIDLGACLRARRIAAGMSQAALGAVVGVSFQQMQKYEQGKDRVSAGTLFLFATALRVPVGSFFEGALQQVPAKPPKSGPGDGISARIVVLFQQIDDLGLRKQIVSLAAALALATSSEQAP